MVDFPGCDRYGPATMHVSREREEEERVPTGTRPPEPAAPETVRPGSLDWASAMGNQAVARLARQALEHEDEAGESEAESEPDDAPPEVAALESQGIGMDDMAALSAVDDMAEGDLPE
jgi:hypothetical protein